MGRRTVLLIAALVVAAMGTALVFMYANRAEDAALAGQQPVEVLVATSGIPAGSSGSAISEAGSVELQKLPAAAVPPEALGDLTPVAELVTVGTVLPGQVLLQPMFGAQQAAAGGLTLPSGTMAVSVQLDDPQRVAGFVQPGSEVAIYVTNIRDDDASETNLLLERVQVVAVGPSTISTTTTTDEGTMNTEEIPAAIITLAVNQRQAQRVILAANSPDTELQFALLDQDSKVNADVASTTTAALLR